MSRAQPTRKLTPRQRRLWWSSAATVAGVSALAALVWWIDRARDTDRADARAGVSVEFARSAAGESPLRFTDVAAASGLTMRHGVATRHRALPEDNGSGLAWGDYDGDGDWDLYIVNHSGIAHHGARSGNTHRLYRNNGDGTFTDVTDAAGVADPGAFGMGATFVDYDDDGDEGFLDRHVAAPDVDPQEILGDSRFRHALVAAIGKLPERERLVMGMYYEQEMNLKEIGAVLGVTESRISQLHSQAVARLRTQMKQWI